MATSQVGSTETTHINLQNDVTINGRRFKAGRNVEVPKKQADDVARIDYEHTQYKTNLNVKRKYEVDAGSIAVGGGAQ